MVVIAMLPLSRNIVTTVFVIALLKSVSRASDVVNCDHLDLNNQNHSSQLSQHSQQFVNTSSCPPWSYFNSTTQKCLPFFYYGAKLFNICTYLLEGFCATVENVTELVSLAPCPYYQSEGHTVLQHDQLWYFQLPDNLSILNTYMCGSMNRGGVVCSECESGYGPSPTSSGFQIQCSSCSAYWSGILLYLFLELFPVTLFYLVLLIFRVNIVSAPMTCYIMFSQLIVIWWTCAFDGEDPFISKRMFVRSTYSDLFRNIVLSLYDVWNLRFFHYLFPPFCISHHLRPIHVAFLGYVTVFYPLFLIFLTWLCIELHGHNFRPIVCLWRPFHRCFVRVRRGSWNTKSDVIDVFASFFLLSFSKVMYQTALLWSQQTIQNYRLGVLIGSTQVTNIDLNVKYGSAEHLVYAVPSVLIFSIFNILPTILLLLYPFKRFKALLAKCRLDRIAVNTFVEKFYGCYRDGLDGGRDMRSFAALYFIIRQARSQGGFGGFDRTPLLDQSWHTTSTLS